MFSGSVVFNGEYKERNLLIRYPTMDDVEKLLHYINILSKEQTYIRLQGEQLSMDEETRYMDDFMRKIGQHKAVKLLAFSNEELIAVADIHIQDKVENHVGVFGITVKEGWRGKGIGKLLMQKTIEEGVKNITGLKLITLGVFSDNPVANKMYEKMGFKIYGILPKGIQHKGELVDHVHMYKMVTS